MDQIVETLKHLQGSYSGAFILFWGLLLMGCVAIRVLEFRKSSVTIKAETILFWVFGLAMVAFAALRPIGIARDDLPYLEIYNAVCPTFTCSQWIQGPRDWGWYSLVGLLKSLVPDPRVMLWLAAAGLLLKLGVIYCLARRSLPVLLLYLGLFYEVQDLTAWRVSLAITSFMVGIWSIVRFRTYWNSWTLFACGFFHKQAFVAPLILMGGFFKKNPWLLIVACLAPVVLLLLSIYPQLQQVIPEMSSELKRIVVEQGLDAYVAAKNAGRYIDWRNAPVVVYPQIFLILWLLLRYRLSNDWLESLMAGCLAMGCIFLWGFASLPDAQVRFFEFFMGPTVLLAGVRRLNALELTGVFAVSGVFVIKYNVIHHLLV